MFIDKNSIIINNVNMGQYLVQATYQFNKLWSSDSGRNLAGDQTGTLIGIYPKLVLQFKSLTKEELEIIVPILDSTRQTTIYYDPYYKETKTITTYTGDYEIINKNIIDDNTLNEPFNCSFIACYKR